MKQNFQAVYIVTATTGMYDYSSKWNVAAYFDAEQAEEHRKNAAEAAKAQYDAENGGFVVGEPNRFDLNCEIIDGYIRYSVDVIPLVTGELPAAGLFAATDIVSGGKSAAADVINPPVDGSFAAKLKGALQRT